jgi:hypothetical protein
MEIMNSFGPDSESHWAFLYGAMNPTSGQAKVQKSVDLGKSYGGSGKTASLSRPRIVFVRIRDQHLAFLSSRCRAGSARLKGNIASGVSARPGSVNVVSERSTP